MRIARAEEGRERDREKRVRRTILKAKLLIYRGRTGPVSGDHNSLLVNWKHFCGGRRLIILPAPAFADLFPRIILAAGKRFSWKLPPLVAP